MRVALLSSFRIHKARKAVLPRKFNKFEPVSPGIFRVKSARSRKVIIIDDGHGPVLQRFAQFVQMEHSESRVRFPGRFEIPFHADVQLLRAALEPAASARA